MPVLAVLVQRRGNTRFSGLGSLCNAVHNTMQRMNRVFACVRAFARLLTMYSNLYKVVMRVYVYVMCLRDL